MAVFLAAATVSLWYQIRHQPLVNLAWALETAKASLKHTDDFQAKVSDEIQLSTGCDQTLSRSRVTTVLYILQQDIINQADASVRAGRLQNAEAVVRQALICSPLDGNLWLMTAWLERLVAFDMKRFQALMEISIAHAPLEARTILNRWKLTAPLLSLPGIRISNEMHEDALRALRWLKREDAVMIFKSLVSQGNESLAKRLLAEIDDDRRSYLQDLIHPDQPKEGRSDRFRVFKLQSLTDILPIR